jgi:hypothetical protein
MRIGHVAGWLPNQDWFFMAMAATMKSEFPAKAGIQ